MKYERKFLIAIQARSTSVRFPDKHNELLGGMKIIDHVIEACQKSAEYLNRHKDKNKYLTEVALLIPYNDKLRSRLGVPIFEGPEHDVLKRYKMALDHFKPDYVVRITGDCPLIPPYIISKHIVIAHKNNYDYLSNVDERFRMTPDGVDCEVVSAKLLDYMDEKARTPEEREHVTLMARHKTPGWAKVGFVSSYFDLSHLKYSIDTPEDLRRVREEYDRVRGRYSDAKRVIGRELIHRF